METERIVDRCVDFLIKQKKDDLFSINPEYQRGAVWSRPQEQLFIDSIFRGYAIPTFYFQETSGRKGGLDIIDGQQRINAIHKFVNGNFRTIKPETHTGYNFPHFMRHVPCEWGGQIFSELDEGLKARFNNTPITYFMLLPSEDIDGENEIRDFFIRLQGGTPLSSQEKRDSWPGKFTEFILMLGGKEGMDRASGHDFFNRNIEIRKDVLKRQLAAQIAMLYFERRENNKEFLDIKSKDLDNYYYENIDFEKFDPKAKEFEGILDQATAWLTADMKFRKHEAIHFVLLCGLLMRDYQSLLEKTTISYELKAFRNYCKLSERGDSKSVQYTSYKEHYAQWTKRDIDMSHTIEKRHTFYLRKMYEALHLDDTRNIEEGFTELEEEIIYLRGNKICRICEEPMPWAGRRFQCLAPDATNRLVKLDNTILAHERCLIKDEHDIKKWQSELQEETQHYLGQYRMIMI